MALALVFPLLVPTRKYILFLSFAMAMLLVPAVARIDCGMAPQKSLAEFLPALVKFLDGKLVPFQKFVETDESGKTARCKMVSDGVSIYRSPPERARRNISTAELDAQCKKLPLNVSPVHLRLIAELLRSKRFRSGEEKPDGGVSVGLLL